MTDGGVLSYEGTLGTRCVPCPKDDAPISWPGAMVGAVALLCLAYAFGALMRAIR